MERELADLEAYLSALPEDARTTLEEVRRVIRAVTKDATEAFAYGLPGFRYRGRPLVYFGAAKTHCAIYGLMADQHKEALAGYSTSKGAIRFPMGQPPPEALVRTLLDVRIAAIDAAEAARGRRKSGGRAG